VYAGGRPLWHLSLAVHDPKIQAPVGVLRWSPTIWRRMEALRDQIMRNVGTDEPFIGENVAEMASVLGASPKAMHWRKPLSIPEINRMAPTSEVHERKGRP
jgi:hypothetical protein